MESGGFLEFESGGVAEGVEERGIKAVNYGQLSVVSFGGEKEKVETRKQKFETRRWKIETRN